MTDNPGHQAPRPADLPDPNQAYDALVAALRARRQALGLTQARVAQLAGIAHDHLRELETGKRRPTLYVAVCWGAALNGVPGWAWLSPPGSALAMAERRPWRRRRGQELSYP